MSGGKHNHPRLAQFGIYVTADGYVCSATGCKARDEKRPWTMKLRCPGQVLRGPLS